MLISEIGQLKKNKIFYSRGFSLLEIIIVLSIISTLSFFISLSPTFFNSQNKLNSIEKKLNLIENEFEFLKQYALSESSIIVIKNIENLFFSKNELSNKDSFKDCNYLENKIKKIYIFPSGITTKVNLICKIEKKEFIISINKYGKPTKYE